MRPEVAQYMMGMRNTSAGRFFEFRGARYSGPLLAFFKPEPPSSWWNVRKGGFVLRKTASSTVVTVFSGHRILEEGHSIDFEFSVLITPVKKLNSAAQFRDRYYHGGNLIPTDAEVEPGIRIINLHHANVANPYINYPFLAIDTLKGMVDAAHARGLKLKLYYTIREMTSHVTEFWPSGVLDRRFLLMVREADIPGSASTAVPDTHLSGINTSTMKPWGGCFNSELNRALPLVQLLYRRTIMACQERRD
jgi:hypothetical protein